ncbi:MAG: 6-phosphogluconolactonase [Rudaea sp.]|uniref:6-phosphogluconolactonase n=1 Tax=Rudaea sp. TaxID=2136325 RepID=UPI0039E687AD
MSALDYRRFGDGAQLAEALAGAIADDLAHAIAERGQALLAVSGGRTPQRFLQTLSMQPVDWSKVVVTLVDERWVPPTDARSNETFVRANLLQGRAAAARFVPLYEAGAAAPEDGMPAVTARVAMLDLPFDALVLGMGEDGHTASFFPDGDHLAEATDPKTDAVVLPMRAPGAGEPRITLTLPVILDSRAIYLHIEGERKREVLENARYVAATNRAWPISAVLRNAHAPVKVYWCP